MRYPKKEGNRVYIKHHVQMKQQIFSIAVSDVTFSVSDFLAMLKAPTANDKVYLR